MTQDQLHEIWLAASALRSYLRLIEGEAMIVDDRHATIDFIWFAL